MKVKLIDGSEVAVSSVSKTFYESQAMFKESNENKVITSISIQEPAEDFDYYKNLFTINNVKTFDVLNNSGVKLYTFEVSEVQSVSYSLQDSGGSFVNIQLA